LRSTFPGPWTWSEHCRWTALWTATSAFWSMVKCCGSRQQRKADSQDAGSIDSERGSFTADVPAALAFSFALPTPCRLAICVEAAGGLQSANLDGVALPGFPFPVGGTPRWVPLATASLAPTNHELSLRLSAGSTVYGLSLLSPNAGASP